MEDTPAIIPMVSSSPHMKNRVFIVLAGFLIALVYIGINIGIWMYANNSRKSAQTVVETGRGVEEEQTGQSAGESATTQESIREPASTPTPTPRLTGPGPYACDPLGICNHYQNATEKGCPRTYADDHCLDECADKKVQCPK
ncbi:MAG: hypothetical protein WC525_08265 [Candidatus Thermoplasmatota archaeon]